MSVTPISNKAVNLWWTQLSEQKKLQFQQKYLSSWSQFQLSTSVEGKRIIYTKLYTDINNK